MQDLLNGLIEDIFECNYLSIRDSAGTLSVGLNNNSIESGKRQKH